MTIVALALRKLLDERGIEIYLDKYRYYSLAEDYISGRDDQFLKFLSDCADSGVLDSIYKIHEAPSVYERRALLRQTELLFLQNRRYSPDDVSRFFENYCEAFGWSMVEISYDDLIR